MALKVGDKVKILSKSYWGSLEHSIVYKRGNGYGYVVEIGNGCLLVNDKKGIIDGDFFLESDLEKVEETINLIPTSFGNQLYSMYNNFLQGYKCEFKGECIQDLLKEEQKQLNNKLIEKSMNIVKFAKDLTLSKEEKLLRKVGLKDEEGNWTEEAMRIVENKLAKKLGFKGASAMYDKYSGVEDCDYDFSILEIHNGFKEFKKELIQIATEFEKENKKK